jgi:hypothetical protein
MADNRIEIIQRQKSFYRSGTDYVHKWRRNITFDLLDQFEQKLVNDDATLQRLRNQRAQLQNELSSTFQSLKVTEQKEQEAKVGVESLKEDLKNAKLLAEQELNAEIEIREQEKQEQVRSFAASQAKYEAEIAEYAEKVKVMAEQNSKLRLLSTNAVQYITDPKNSWNFYGYLAFKGIVMDPKVFQESMADLRSKTADQLLLSMGEGFLALLDDVDFPTEKQGEIPPLPQAKAVFPSPFFEVNGTDGGNV